MTEERLEALMVAVVDGVATPADREALMRHLADHPELMKEYESHMSIKALTDGWIARLEGDVARDAHAARPATRAEARIGGALVLTGLALLTGFGLMEVLLEPSAPLWLRAGVGLCGAGCLVLLVSAVRWRIATGKSDRYSEVIR